MTHQDAIADLVVYILKNGEGYLNLIKKGNAYDKIIRNFHQFNSAGKKVSGNKRARLHYKFSVSAWKSDKTQWYFEHLVPIKMIKEKLSELINSDNITSKKVKEILNLTEYVVITKEEARLINRKYKSSVPINGLSRLQVCKIEIHSQSLKNTL